jgi:flavodoxin
VLLAYFSRAGENYYYGDRIELEVVNTEVLAGMLKQLTGCDVYRIVEADPYPDSYDATRERNLEEQRANARPAIAKALPSIERYDTVLLASGIWGNRAPMIMTTFAEGLDFTGKTIHPVTTYAVSGLGSTERDYAGSCPGADVGEGFAVRGEETEDAGGYRTRALVRSAGRGVSLPGGAEIVVGDLTVTGTLAEAVEPAVAHHTGPGRDTRLPREQEGARSQTRKPERSIRIRPRIPRKHPPVGRGRTRPLTPVG